MPLSACPWKGLLRLRVGAATRCFKVLVHASVPQYQSLLNEGFLEVENQQTNQIKAEQEEHAVIRTASDTNDTAKEVRVVSSQTDKPLVKPTRE